MVRIDDQLGFQAKTVSQRINNAEPLIVLDPGRSIWITDIITTGNITLYLQDDINTFELGDFNGNFSHSFNGIFHTWRDAKLTAKGVGTVLITFIPLIQGKDYAQWLYLNKTGGNYG